MGVLERLCAHLRGGARGRHAVSFAVLVHLGYGFELRFSRPGSLVEAGTSELDSIHREEQWNVIPHSGLQRGLLNSPSRDNP